jgi:hypothetical protein
MHSMNKSAARIRGPTHEIANSGQSSLSRVLVLRLFRRFGVSEYSTSSIRPSFFLRITPEPKHPYLPLVIQPKPKPEIPGMSSGTPSCTRDPRLVRAREASSGTGDIFQGCFVSFVFFSLIGLLSKAESLGGCRGRDLCTDD